MAISLKKYLIDGFVVEEVGGKVMRATVPFIATGVPVLPANGEDRDPHVLYRALQAAGLPAYGDGYPDDPTCRVARRFVRGLKSETDDAHLRIDVFYEQPDFGFPLQPNQFALRDSFTLIQRPTQMIQKFTGPTGPGPLVPIRVGFIRNQEVIAEDSLTINAYSSFRVLTATAIFTGRAQTDTFASFANCVNADNWYGYPKGYWLCTGPDTDITQLNPTNSANSQTRVSVSFLSQTDGPWMYDGILRNQRDGKYRFNAEQLANLNRDYVNDVVFPQNQPIHGLVRVGPYRMRTFGNVFPFGIQTGGGQQSSGSAITRPT